MLYDVILFDLVGTLTESAPGIMRSARIAVEQMGYSGFDPCVFKTFIGPPLHGCFREHFGMDDARAEEAVRRYRAHYAEHGIFENAVYRGMPNLLRRLRAGGARLFVATAKPQVFADRVLRRFGLARFFEGVVGATLDERTAGKAALIRTAMPAVAGRAAMIGDRRYDIEGGRANGIDTVGVCYGYGSRAELAEAGATHIVDTVDELGGLLAADVPPPPGFFVTVEGLDGSGKTTQIDRLAAHLQQLGYDTLRTREPGGSPIAEKIRELVLSPGNLGMHAWTEALLYAAARAEHVRGMVRPALAEGRVVLCDRYVDSSAAYQGVGRALGLERVLEVNALATGGLRPDLTLYLRLDAAEALARRGRASSLDRIEMERDDFHRRVCDAYDQLAARDPERIRVIDAALLADEIAASACTELDMMLARR